MDRSGRDHNLISLDHYLMSVLMTDHSDSLALADQHTLNESVLHKVSTVVLGILQEGHHRSLLLSKAASESTPSTGVLLVRSVLRNILERVPELVASLKKKSISGVVLQVLVRDSETSNDGVDGLLVGRRCEVRETSLGPFLANKVWKLEMTEVNKK